MHCALRCVAVAFLRINYTTALRRIRSTRGVRNNTRVPYVSYLVPLLCFTKLCAGICAMDQIQLVIEAHAYNTLQAEIAALFLS